MTKHKKPLAIIHYEMQSGQLISSSLRAGIQELKSKYRVFIYSKMDVEGVFQRFCDEGVEIDAVTSINRRCSIRLKS